MTPLTVPRVLNIRETRSESPPDDAENIAEDVRKAREETAGDVFYVTVSNTAAFTRTTRVFTCGWHERIAVDHPDEDHLRSWQEFVQARAGNGGSVESSTHATHATSTTVSSIRRLLRCQLRDERLAGLSPERRSLYESISNLRDNIGQVDFDIVDALGELRSDG